MINFETIVKGRKVQLKVYCISGESTVYCMVRIDGREMSEYFYNTGENWLTNTFKHLNNLLNDPSRMPWHGEISYLYSFLEVWEVFNENY